MAINIFEPEVLAKAVSVVPKPSTFFKDTFFKNVHLNPTTKVRVDLQKGTRRVAPFVSEVDANGVTKKIGYVTEDYITPLVKVSDVTKIDDIVKRGFGENLYGGITPQERAYDELLRTFRDFEQQITRREEVMCAEAMLNGAITVKGEGVDYLIDFGFTNKGTVSVLWDADGSTADPIADLQAWSALCLKNGYKRPNICVMERSAYTAFLNRCMALGYLDNKYFTNPVLAPRVKSDNVIYCGRLTDPDLEIYCYEEWYVDDWSGSEPTEKPIMPKGKILLASTFADYSIEYGAVTFLDSNTKDFRTVVGERAADSWINKNPDCRFIALNARPLPVPTEVDSWFVGIVSTTE